MTGTPGGQESRTEQRLAEGAGLWVTQSPPSLKGGLGSQLRGGRCQGRYSRHLSCLSVLSTLDYQVRTTSHLLPPTSNPEMLGWFANMCHPLRSGFPPKKVDFFKPLCKSINHVIHLPSTRGSSWSHPSCVAQIWNVRETRCIRSISELPVKGFSTHSFVLVFSGASQEGPAPHQQITGRTRELGGKTTSL